MQVGFNVRGHRLAAIQPIKELSDEPSVHPLGLLQQANLCALPLPAVLLGRVGKTLNASVVHDQGFMLTFNPHVLPAPPIEPAGVGLGPLIHSAHPVLKGHHHMRLRATAVLTPGRVPSLRVDGVTFGPSQVSNDVQMMHGPFDHEGFVHCMAEMCPPIAEIPQPTGKTTDDIVNRARTTRT